MSTVMPQDILFRAGGATLKRLQALCSAGGSRIEVAHTYTRATVKRAFRDRDGNAKRAAATYVGIDWPTGLVDVNGNPYGGPLIEGARNQLVPDPENFGAWAIFAGTPTLTSGQTDPFGGTAAYKIVDDDAASQESIRETVVYTGDGVKCYAVFVKRFDRDTVAVGLRDNTAGSYQHRVLVTFNAAGVLQSVTTLNGSGTIFPSLDVGGGWYRIAFNGTVIAANTNYVTLFGADGTNASTGGAFFYGANTWNSPFPQSYQAPGADATGVADALTAPFNLGPQDITVLVRLARPSHADASGALGISPGIFSFGAGSAARIGAYFDPAARNIVGVIDTATTDQTVSAAIPAGNPTVSFQFKNLTTGGQVAIDTGSGLSAFSSAATGFSAFSSQTVRIGRYDDELYGVIGDMVVARGLFTRSEMLAVE